MRLDTAGWVERRKPATRIALLVAAIILALLVAGVLTGFVVGSVEHGHLLPRTPRGWAVLIAILAVSYGLYRAIRLLLGPSLSTELSPFEQRYSKMWLLIILLGIPVGFGLGMLSRHGDRRMSFVSMFLEGPLPPVGAISLAAALAIFFGIAAILYHRAIDDHEERAYLWGSQIAYYFLAVLIPIYWLLSRGDVVPSLTASGAMLMLLASFIVQASVWAWFKFR